MTTLPNPNPPSALLRRVVELQNMGYLELHDWVYVKNNGQSGRVWLLTERGFACLSASAEPPIKPPPARRKATA